MKKIIALVLTLALALCIFASCGKDTDTESKPTENKTIVVGASSTPHAEILEQVKDALKADGYTLEIKIFDDYILPNQALTDGSLDANYFQHTPYLDSYNAENKTDIKSAVKVHYEPFGIYANGVSDLKSLEKGAQIIIPADDSNETRALFLLKQEGLIELADDATVEKGVSVLDIKNDNGYKVTAVQADTVPAQLNNSDKGTIAVINGNYAIAAGLNVKDALAIENAEGDAAQYYANIIAVRNGDENSEKIKALVKALQTEDVRKFIEGKYNGAVVAVF